MSKPGLRREDAPPAVDVLSTKKGHEAWVEPIVDKAHRVVRFRVRTGSGGVPEALKVGRGLAFRCLVCEQVAGEVEIKRQIAAAGFGTQLVATVAEGRRQRVYVSADDDQELAARLPEAANIPEEVMSTHPQYMGPPRYGLTRFGDIFSPRQAAVLTTLVELLDEVVESVPSDCASAPDGRNAEAYADAVRTYLAFAISKGVNYWTTVCSWHQAAEKMVSTFGLPVMAMVWDYAEANPFSSSSGNWTLGVEQAAECLEGLPARGAAAVEVRDAKSPTPYRGVLVSTDPPYYDNVPYSDLADLFYVWLRRSIGQTYPDLFSTLITPKDDELIADSERFGGKAKAKERFEHGLKLAMSAVREAASPEYPVTIYYAFKQSEAAPGSDGAISSTGWETMLEGLLSAGFAIDGTWPVRTEQPGGLREAGRNALASSIVLVCRPRHTDAAITTRRELVASLKRELPKSLRELQHGNIAPVDLAQSAIGPGMAVFSRYARVLEPDGSPMRVRTALGLINQVLDEILAEQEGEFDADTRWAVAWYEQFGLREAEFGVADVLARAKNTSVQGMVEAGIVAAGRGKVRLLARDEYDLGWDPAHDRRLPTWEAAQRLVHVLLTGGEGPATDLLARLGGVGDTARDLAYRLYQVAERKGWAEEARAYNALVVVWSDLTRAAAVPPGTGPVQPSLGLE